MRKNTRANAINARSAAKSGQSPERITAGVKAIVAFSILE
jgi:hypothetical protein